MTSLSIPVHRYRENARSECIECPYPEGFSVHMPNAGKGVKGQHARLPELDSEHDREGEVDNLVNGEVPTGMMVALFPDMETAKTLKVPGGEKARSLHVTLAYLPGDLNDVADTATLLSTVADFARDWAELDGEISGLGIFTAGDGAVTYASVDVPGLPRFREDLVARLDGAGLRVADNHGYTPHMTLAYGDKRTIDVPNLPLHFNAVTVAIQGQMTSFPLLQKISLEDLVGEAVMVPVGAAATEAKGPLVKGEGTDKPHDYKGLDTPDTEGVPSPCQKCKRDKDDPIHGGNHASDMVQAGPLLTTQPRIEPKTVSPEDAHLIREGEAPDVPISQAFVSEVNGKTFITGQAAAFSRVPASWEKALNPNPHMLWMQGRFVGGEKANRNGAFWSTADLEMGEPTVKYGPLNWLHEARHVIGVIADSRLKTHDLATDTKLDEPYIEAASGIWRWIYPDEAWVVENASDAGKLWYSMECISADVECVGDGSCGESVGYFDYMKGAGCAHMQQRSATRRFVDPIFLGGAVIVPPVRPGWAEADATVMQQAAAMAELAYEQAGRPDVTASEWEQIMAQVVRQAA